MRNLYRLFLAIFAVLLVIAPVMAQDNDLEANKALVRAFFDAEANRDYNRMDALFKEDFVRHSAASTAIQPDVRVKSLAEYKQLIQGYVAQFPDYRNNVMMMAAEGDYVAFYSLWPATYVETGKHVEVPMVGFFRIEDGKLAELWIEWENVSFGSQIGAPGSPPYTPQEKLAGTYTPPATDKDSNPEANKALVLAWTEAENTRAYDRLDAIVADDFVRHSSATPEVKVASREEMVAFLKATDELYPDNKHTNQMMIAEGDLVAGYNLFSGTDAATGKHFELPFVYFFRVQDGKLAESWVEWDNLTMMAQLGLLPPPAQAQTLAGIYTTTITEADLVNAKYDGSADLVGDWEIQYTEDGRVLAWFKPADLKYGRELADTSGYSTTADTLVFSESPGGIGCAPYNVASATYKWAWDGAQLTLTNVDDICTERVIVATSHPMVRVSSTE